MNIPGSPSVITISDIDDSIMSMDRDQEVWKRLH